MKLPLVFEEFEYSYQDSHGKPKHGDSPCYRAKVPGGWIVKPQRMGHEPWVFVPDPEHAWEV